MRVGMGVSPSRKGAQPMSKVLTCLTGTRDSSSDESAGNVTELLVAWGRGDEGALDVLAPLVQQELHRLAARFMAGERRDTPPGDCARQ